MTPEIVPANLELFTFDVTSRTRNVTHRVDMTKRRGMGICTCENFAYGALPAFDRNGGVHVPHGTAGATECHHIAVVRAWLERNLLRSMLAACEDGTPPEVMRVVEMVRGRAGSGG